MKQARPHSHRTRGYLYALSPSPEPPPPPQYLGKIIYPLIPGIGYHWQLHKTAPFPSENLPETAAKTYPFPEKMGIHMRPPPPMYSSGGGGEDPGLIAISCLVVCRSEGPQGGGDSHP